MRRGVVLAVDGLGTMAQLARLVSISARTLRRATLRGELRGAIKNGDVLGHVGDAIAWAATRRRARQVTHDEYAPGLVRVRVKERPETELTCATHELGTLRAWAIVHLGHVRSEPMPVAEYRDPRWCSAYRWTQAAHEAWVRSREPRDRQTA